MGIAHHVDNIAMMLNDETYLLAQHTCETGQQTEVLHQAISMRQRTFTIGNSIFAQDTTSMTYSSFQTINP